MFLLALHSLPSCYCENLLAQQISFADEKQESGIRAIESQATFTPFSVRLFIGMDKTNSIDVEFERLTLEPKNLGNMRLNRFLRDWSGTCIHLHAQGNEGRHEEFLNNFKKFEVWSIFNSNYSG